VDDLQILFLQYFQPAGFLKALRTRRCPRTRGLPARRAYPRTPGALTLRAREAYTAGEAPRRMNVVALALFVSLIAPAQEPRASTSGARTRDVYVSVLDSRGAPIQGLTAKDFTVREDRTPREVLKAGPATEPLQVALLIDDSQAATSMLQPLREGITAFIDKLQGKAEIALITFGERPTTIVEYTTSAEQLKKGVGRVFARSGAGPYLLEAIIETSRGLEKRKAGRPVIVAVTIEGLEFSNQHYQPVLEALERSGAAFHTLAVGSPADSQSDEMRNRNMVIAEGTERSGGRREQVLADSGLPERMRQVADELLNQYVVTYGRPETLIPPQRIEVSSTRPGVTVRARTRLPGR
jgi:VWFA-related protein